MLDQEACQGPAKPSARTTAGGSAGATNANQVCHEQHGGTGGEVDMEQSASLPAGAGATAAAPLSGRSRPAGNEAERLGPFSWDGYATLPHLAVTTVPTAQYWPVQVCCTYMMHRFHEQMCNHVIDTPCTIKIYNGCYTYTAGFGSWFASEGKIVSLCHNSPTHIRREATSFLLCTTVQQLYDIIMQLLKV